MRHSRRWTRHVVDAVRQRAGVGDQDTTCKHGTPGCPGPGARGDTLPCGDCFFDGNGGDIDA